MAEVKVENIGVPLRVIIAGGGTGGHLFPGVALAEEIRAQGGEVLFVGTQNGLEARVLPKEGWELEVITISGIKGQGMRGVLAGFRRFPQAWWQSRRILKKFKPDVVVGVGGYASGPLVATAASLGIPTAIMEQNSVPGLTNRILARMVKRVFTTFPDVRGLFPAGKVIQTGNPIRQRLQGALQASDSKEIHPPRLFVFGGSQGARAINDAVVNAIPQLLAEFPDLEIWHQTGASEIERVRAQYEQLYSQPSWVKISAFIDDMAAPYRWCDVILCRAGATTLSELAFVGKPAILIPFPFAADNHQEGNGQAFVDQGAAVMIRQSEQLVKQLAEHLMELLNNPTRRLAMSAAMLRAACPQAAKEIHACLIQLVQTKIR